MSAAQYIVLLAAATLYGCAGNGDGLDANGNPVTPGSTGNGTLTADFQSIQDHVFTPICTKCHIGASAPQGLQLDAAHSYALLVGVPSNEQPSVLRVAPGDPDSSYIVRKLEGLPGISGGQMPLGGPYLPQPTIDVIRQWIAAGAAKPAAVTQGIESAVRAVQHFAVDATSPDDGAIVSDAVSQIIVVFNGDIDSTLINTTTVGITRSDGGGAAPSPVLLAAVVPAGNPAALLITPQAPLGNGSYRLTLHGSLANLSAQALGTDVSFTFTVDVLQ